MTRDELRSTLEKFYCGCGNPEAASASLLRLLEMFERLHDRGKPGAPAPYLEFPKWLPDKGLQNLVLYFVTQEGLLEHGGGVFGSWLTPLGEEVLTALREEAKDGFRRLHHEPASSMAPGKPFVVDFSRGQGRGTGTEAEHPLLAAADRLRELADELEQFTWEGVELTETDAEGAKTVTLVLRGKRGVVIELQK